jgi:peptidylprolyl isomerase
VAQILSQANQGFYDDSVFHRVIEGFMAQGGWTKKVLPHIQAEFNDIPHVEGICSMARTNDPNSASDQFFICFGDASFLNGQYTVFGEVISGMDLVDKIKKGDPNNNGSVTSPDRMIKVRLASNPD